MFNASIGSLYWGIMSIWVAFQVKFCVVHSQRHTPFAISSKLTTWATTRFRDKSFWLVLPERAKLDTSSTSFLLLTFTFLTYLRRPRSEATTRFLHCTLSSIRLTKSSWWMSPSWLSSFGFVSLCLPWARDPCVGLGSRFVDEQLSNYYTISITKPIKPIQEWLLSVFNPVPNRGLHQIQFLKTGWCIPREKTLDKSDSSYIQEWHSFTQYIIVQMHVYLGKMSGIDLSWNAITNGNLYVKCHVTPFTCT